ncbi:MAG: hypothetical protein ACYTBJ_25830 [Planctomycetota bacterium]|jgi:hypothetical protein
MHIELADCTGHLLGEIGNRKMTRRDVAQSYRLAMASSEATDWAEVNRAIIDRWSESALVYIKRQAWSGRCFAGQRRADDITADG